MTLLQEENFQPLKLTDRTLEELAKMVVGDVKHFPYRSSYFITKFFSRCGLPFTHDGTTRPIWAQDRLSELNLGACQSADLPSDDLCRVISELFDADDFERHNDKAGNRGETNLDYYAATLPQALAAFNKLVQRQGLIAGLDDSGRCYLRSTGTGVSTATFSQQTRPLSQQEIEQRQKSWLNSSTRPARMSLSRRCLFPLFQRLRLPPRQHDGP